MQLQASSAWGPVLPPGSRRAGTRPRVHGQGRARDPPPPCTVSPQHPAPRPPSNPPQSTGQFWLVEGTGLPGRVADSGAGNAR